MDNMIFFNQNFNFILLYSGLIFEVIFDLESKYANMGNQFLIGWEHFKAAWKRNDSFLGFQAYVFNFEVGYSLTLFRLAG